MTLRGRIQQFLPIALIMMLLAFVSYKNATKSRIKQEVCTVEKSEGAEEARIKSGLPMWESLTRHLMRVSN